MFSFLTILKSADIYVEILLEFDFHYYIDFEFQFLKFMNNVSDGQVRIVENETIRTNEEFSKWANEPTSIIQGNATMGEARTTGEAKDSFSRWGSLPAPEITSTSAESDGIIIVVVPSSFALDFVPRFHQFFKILSCGRRSWLNRYRRSVLEGVMVEIIGALGADEPRRSHSLGFRVQ